MDARSDSRVRSPYRARKCRQDTISWYSSDSSHEQEPDQVQGRRRFWERRCAHVALFCNSLNLAACPLITVRSDIAHCAPSKVNPWICRWRIWTGRSNFVPKEQLRWQGKGRNGFSLIQTMTANLLEVSAWTLATVTASRASLPHVTDHVLYVKLYLEPKSPSFTWSRANLIIFMSKNSLSTFQASSKKWQDRYSREQLDASKKRDFDNNWAGENFWLSVVCSRQAASRIALSSTLPPFQDRPRPDDNHLLLSPYR
jgi:hypothetical protein